tara:strand:- start:424 stop:675 length:252 start_codon:yes stop_codon:yes gene_type:complete
LLETDGGVSISTQSRANADVENYQTGCPQRLCAAAIFLVHKPAGIAQTSHRFSTVLSTMAVLSFIHNLLVLLSQVQRDYWAGR